MAKIYYTNETRTRFILRITEKSLSISAIVLLLGMAISMQTYTKELDVYAEDMPDIVDREERISVKEELFNYIDTLPVPEENEEQLQIETQQQMIEDVVEVLPTTMPEAETTQTEIRAEVTNTSTYNVSYEKSDVELLARLMYAEEGKFIYELSEEDAKYVNQLAGSVVLHRRNTNFDGCKTIRDVIYEKGQYDSVARGTLNQEVPDIVYEWAEELLQNGPIGPDNLVYQAEFPQGSEVYEHIGNQYFCIR